MQIKIIALLSLLILGGGFACSSKETPAATLTMSGEALYRERIAVPADVQFEVVLEDTSLADAPAKLLGNSQIINAGQPPYKFTIQYAAKDIITGHRYNLRARLTHAGQLLFITDQHYPVLETGKENQTQLLLVRVRNETDSAATIPTNALLNTYWKLVSINNTAVTVAENQREPHLVFHAENRMAGSDGCNSLTGSYELDGDTLQFKQLALTMMACLYDEQQAQMFKAALDKVASYEINGDRLELYNDANTILASFKAVALP